MKGLHLSQRKENKLQRRARRQRTCREAGNDRGEALVPNQRFFPPDSKNSVDCAGLKDDGRREGLKIEGVQER